MSGRPANEDMVAGYMDGLNPDSPEPSSNRTRSYRHGFRAGRADRGQRWQISFDEITRLADEAMRLDAIDAGQGSGA
jgi:hypothetical protein